MLYDLIDLNDVHNLCTYILLNITLDLTAGSSLNLVILFPIYYNKL